MYTYYSIVNEIEVFNLNFKKIFLICLVLLMLMVGVASASQDLDEDVSGDCDDFALSNQGDVDEDEDDLDEDDDFSEVSIEIPDYVEIGCEDVVEIELPEDAKGNVYIKVDNKSWSSFSVDGDVNNLETVSLDDLSCGLHLVNVTFISSTSNYGTVSKQALVNVTYNIAITLVQDPYIYGNEENLVYISAPRDILFDVKVMINDKLFNLTKDSDSRGYINISGFDGGSYLIVASFEGNDNYDAYSTNETINVASAINIPDFSLSYNSEAYVILKLPSDADGFLELTFDGQLIDSVEFINGQAKIKFPTSKVGAFYYNVTYTGDDFDIDDIIDEYVQIIPKINVPKQMTVGENKYITFDMNDDAGGYFIIGADYEEYATVNSNGRVSLANLEDGDVDISVTYYGDNEFLYIYEDSFTVTVNPLPIRFAGVKNINMLYGDGTTYSLNIYGRNGKPLEEYEYIEFKIGKKIYDAYTNHNGVVSFKIPDSVLPGKYSVTVNYEDMGSVKSNLVVNQILSFKKVNVKKSAKKLILKASLKKVNNKFLKGKLIVFKFNGKSYKVKTDKNGVAKVKINSNLLKKLKVGKKIKYQATYLKSTIKYSVKIKK